MKVLYVGGKHFFNRFGSLEAAVERAENDDIIELCKDEKDVSVQVFKNITINGNGHIVSPKDGKAAFDCGAFITLNNIRFDTKPRTNAVIVRRGGRLNRVFTRIIGPARALYPTVVHRGGELDIDDSDIMFIETYKGHGEHTITSLRGCRVLDYYGGFAYLDNKDYDLSKFRSETHIRDCELTCTLLEGDCTISDTVFHNYNKITGTLNMKSCKLKAGRGEIVMYPNEPVDGPLKHLRKDVIPYALHIAGGRVTTENHSSETTRDCIGFYMTGGSLDIRATKTCNDQSRHLIKGGSVVFNNVTDDAFYEIRQARCGIVRSNVNTSSKGQSAMQGLDSMIGLASVKEQLHTIMNTITVNLRYPEKDFGFSYHMVFAGDPGTGKTTVAKLVAQALFEIGAIPENKCMEVPASQLIKGYVGQTGEHVEEVMKKALGGVLFIDEAYELMVKDNQASFNGEALAVILRYMEDHRKDLVVIAAGYEKEMKQFIASNVGLTRRFQWVSFEDYTPMEMADIFMSMAKQYGDAFQSAEPRAMLVRAFDKLTGFYLTHPDAKGRTTNGGNGGLVRNLFQQVVFARNNRAANDPKATMRITDEDIQIGFNKEMQKAINVQSSAFSF